jgi:bifunctional DNase/RNase
MIEVEIDSIRVSLMSDHRLMVLREVGSERFLPIWIGQCEAEAIAIHLRGVQIQRPMTHDLLKNVIAELGGEIAYVVVNDLRNDTFYARIAVNVDRRLLEIDARSSDAVALAVRANVPIFVEEKVMEAAGVLPEEDLGEQEPVEDGELSAFRDFVNKLDLDDLPLQ